MSDMCSGYHTSGIPFVLLATIVVAASFHHHIFCTNFVGEKEQPRFSGRVVVLFRFARFFDSGGMMILYDPSHHLILGVQRQL